MWKGIKNGASTSWLKSKTFFHTRDKKPILTKIKIVFGMKIRIIVATSSGKNENLKKIVFDVKSVAYILLLISMARKMVQSVLKTISMSTK